MAENGRKQPLRRRQSFDQKRPQLIDLTQPPAAPDDVEMNSVPDERLKLIFTCCHPALSLEAQVALTLRTLGGLETAEIAALHDQAATPQQTDWPQIVALYQALQRYTNSPVVTLNWAVAVAMAEGPLRGLALLDDLVQTGILDHYHLFHAARADLLRRAGFADDAHDAYSIALDLCQNSVEKRFLRRRLAELQSGK